MYKHLLAALAGAALTVGSGLMAQAEDALDRVMSAGVLKVGTETAFAPFDYIDAGKHTGFNTDIYAIIGEEMGVDIEWITLDWTGVLPGLEAGRFDVVAGSGDHHQGTHGTLSVHVADCRSHRGDPELCRL